MNNTVRNRNASTKLGEVEGDFCTRWNDDDSKMLETALWHVSMSITNGQRSYTRCRTTEWLKGLKTRFLSKGQDFAECRKTMEAVRLYLKGRVAEDGDDGSAKAMLDRLERVLAKNPRNCDVGTTVEQNRRYENFCCKRDNSPCKNCEAYKHGVQCQLVWAQLPYSKDDE